MSYALRRSDSGNSWKHSQDAVHEVFYDPADLMTWKEVDLGDDSDGELAQVMKMEDFDANDQVNILGKLP
jgi:hypothetical protein